MIGHPLKRSRKLFVGYFVKYEARAASPSAAPGFGLNHMQLIEAGK